MNEHKVSEGKDFKEMIPQKSTDIEVMGHYVGKGYVKEVRLGLPAGSFATQVRKTKCS